MKKITIFFTVAFVITACHFNSTSLNDEEDIKDAKKIATKFYELKSKKDSIAIYKMVGEDFYKENSKSDLIKVIHVSDSLYGMSKKKKLINANTKRVEGDSSFTSYQLLYEVEYESLITEEEFYLEKKEGGEIKIIGFFIRTKLLRTAGNSKHE